MILVPSCSNDSNAQDSGLELVYVEGAGHSNSQMASTAVENSGFAVPPWEFHTAWVKVPIANGLHPLAGPKWSNKNDGLTIAQVLRVLEVCFGTSWSLSSCLAFISLSWGATLRSARHAGETWQIFTWDLMGPIGTSKRREIFRNIDQELPCCEDCNWCFE